MLMTENASYMYDNVYHEKYSNRVKFLYVLFVRFLRIEMIGATPRSATIP
jgi:hypothetical protein